MAVGEEQQLVGAGDVAWLPYGMPHSLENNDDDNRIILVTAAMPRYD